jgi:hypothetical protein
VPTGVNTFVVTGRAATADVPGKMPGTAGKMPALPGNPESSSAPLSIPPIRRNLAPEISSP